MENPVKVAPVTLRVLVTVTWPKVLRAVKVLAPFKYARLAESVKLDEAIVLVEAEVIRPSWSIVTVTGVPAPP